MPELRQLNITGGAAHDYNKSKGLVGTRKRKKTKMQEDEQMGGDSPSGPNLTPSSTNVVKRNLTIYKGGAAHATLPGSQPPNPQNLNVPAVNASLAKGTMPLPIPAPPINKAETAPLPTFPALPPSRLPSMLGGAAAAAESKGKLTLAPPKKKTRSAVLLAPPAHRAKTHRKGVQQTRKIRVQLSGLKKRMTKAKKIHKDSRDKSINEIRKLLEEAKLVKPHIQGKPPVPESVLRDIYKDYLLLRNRAL
jgi:hypothetical protein